MGQDMPLRSVSNLSNSNSLRNIITGLLRQFLPNGYYILTPLILVILSFIGGCAGSTAGGIKVMRIMLLAKLGLRQLELLMHPRSVSVVKLGKRPISETVLFSIWGFYVLYIVTALMLTAGLDLITAFWAVVATINLLGPGLGEVPRILPQWMPRLNGSGSSRCWLDASKCSPC